jgi:hypothetical protein
MGQMLTLLFTALLLGGTGCEAEDPMDGSHETSAGAFTCRDLKNCRRDCGNEVTCLQACDSKATPSVKATYRSAEACVEASSCKDDACVEKNCGEHLRACLPPLPTAPLNCRELKNCLRDCANNACGQACEARATELASAAYAAVKGCAEASGCMDDQCLAQRCGLLLDICLR